VSRRFGAVSVDALRRRNQNRSLYLAADIAEAHQFAPGAECVGTYAVRPGVPPVIDIDFHCGVLSARLGASTTWTPLAARGSLNYELTTPPGMPSGMTTLRFEGAAGTVDQLTLDAGGASSEVLVRIR
jgi:hypothetical protein